MLFLLPNWMSAIVSCSIARHHPAAKHFLYRTYMIDQTRSLNDGRMRPYWRCMWHSGSCFAGGAAIRPERCHFGPFVGIWTTSGGAGNEEPPKGSSWHVRSHARRPVLVRGRFGDTPFRIAILDQTTWKVEGMGGNLACRVARRATLQHRQSNVRPLLVGHERLLLLTVAYHQAWGHVRSRPQPR
jgi:hypothetical protein